MVVDRLVGVQDVDEAAVELLGECQQLAYQRLALLQVVEVEQQIDNTINKDDVRMVFLQQVGERLLALVSGLSAKVDEGGLRHVFRFGQRCQVHRLAVHQLGVSRFHLRVDVENARAHVSEPLHVVPLPAEQGGDQDHLQGRFALLGLRLDGDQLFAGEATLVVDSQKVIIGWEVRTQTDHARLQLRPTLPF